MQVLLTGATGDVGRGVRQILIKYNISTISVSSKFQKKQDFIQWDLTKTAPANKIDTKFNAIVSLVDGEKSGTHGPWRKLWRRTTLSISSIETVI